MLTPLLTPLIPHHSGLLLKAENLQPGGSYKIRGVHRFLQQRGSMEGALSTASAGNLGRSLAQACQLRGIPCTVFVPDSTPRNKKERILALGAELVELPFAELFHMVQEPPARKGFLHPLLTPELSLGYGEIAKEILASAPDTDVIVAPFGLGGLSLGLARALQQLGSSAKVVAAELEHCAPFRASLHAGRPVAIEKTNSFVDAIGTPVLLPYVFEEARQLLAGSICVTLEETRRALSTIHLQHRMRVEGAAAAALAAAEKLQRLSPGLRIAVVLSGGNIDLDVFERETHQATLELARVADSYKL